MWRRVPCEQPLHTGQSILSPRRNPMLMVAGCLYITFARKDTTFLLWTIRTSKNFERREQKFTFLHAHNFEREDVP
jgi:hypothetical protein